MIYIINSDKSIETYETMREVHQALHDQSIRLSDGVPVKHDFAICTFTTDQFEVMRAVNTLRREGKL